MRDRGLWTAVLAGLAIAVLTRFWNLADQVIGGDEVHAMRMALALPLGEILSTYHRADNCLPLTAWAKLWLLGGGELSEAVMRTPVLLASLAMVVVVPLLLAVRRAAATGRPGGAAGPAGWLALLLAVWPAVALYGRVARPYAPAALFAWVAILSLAAWRLGQPAAGDRRARRDGWAAAAGLATGLAVWFHPLTVPLLASAYLWAAVDLWWRSGPRSGYRLSRSTRFAALSRLAVPPAVALLLLIGPAVPSLLAVAEANRGIGASQSPNWLGAAKFLAGTASGAWVLVIGGLAGVGLLVLWRRDRELAVSSAVAVGGQILGIVLVHPIGLASGLIFGRYLLFALPGFLLWISWALWWVAGGDRVARGARFGRLRPLFAASLLVGLVVAGPLWRPAYRHSSFVHHDDWLEFGTFDPSLPPNSLPELYRQLPADAVLLEVPMARSWRQLRLPPRYQLLHRRPVIVSLLGNSFIDRPGIALDTWLQFDPEAWLASRATVLVLHRDPAAEAAAAGYGFEVSAAFPEGPGIAPRRAIEALRVAWGRPLYRDDQLVAYDLTAVRSNPERRAVSWKRVGRRPR